MQQANARHERRGLGLLRVRRSAPPPRPAAVLTPAAANLPGDAALLACRLHPLVHRHEYRGKRHRELRIRCRLQPLQLCGVQAVLPQIGSQAAAWVCKGHLCEPPGASCRTGCARLGGAVLRCRLRRRSPRALRLPRRQGRPAGRGARP